MQRENPAVPGYPVNKIFGGNMKIVNLTPHKINILDGENRSVMAVHASGQVARCSTKRVQVGDLDGIQINKTSFGELEGLPSPETGKVYIVSMLAATAAKQQYPEREDIFITDDAVRDENGRIIGCRALAQL